MRGTPGPGQGQRHRLCLFFATVMAEGRQAVGSTLASDDRTEALESRGPRDITAGLRPLPVHLEQGLWHVQEMWGTMRQQVGAMTEHGPEGDAVGFRPQRGAQEPRAMQGVNPLTVHHITLTAGNPFDGLGAEEAATAATGFQLITQGNPRDARRFPGDRLDATVHTPVREAVEVGGLRAKGSYDLLLLAVRHTGPDRMGTKIAPSGMGGTVRLPANGRAAPCAERRR
jgi:hypothetical protein